MPSAVAPTRPTPTNLSASQSERVADMRAAMDEMATSLIRKASHLRAAVNDLDNHDADVSPLEVLSVLAVHDVRVTEADLALHAAVQDAASALVYPTLTAQAVA